MSLRLLQARTALRRIEQEFQQLLLAEYPAGARVHWSRHGHVRSGVVVEVAAHGRVLVRADGSPRSHWIFADDIAEATKPLSGAAA